MELRMKPSINIFTIGTTQLYQNSETSNSTHIQGTHIPLQSIFGIKTMQNNAEVVLHKTNFGSIMQELIGTAEVKGMAPSIITENRNAQWCAYTISYALDETCKKEGKSCPTKNFLSVSQYIKFAQEENRYNSIKTQSVSDTNLEEDREKRAKEITAQLKNMKEGDLIIWKSPYYAKAYVDGESKLYKLSASHIGMIEKVQLNRETNEYEVWVIEGNANEPYSDEKNERYINSEDSEIGWQKKGEIQEINYCDGIIRKKYTVSDLAKFGYSGYIDMSGIVNPRYHSSKFHKLTFLNIFNK